MHRICTEQAAFLGVEQHQGSTHPAWLKGGQQGAPGTFWYLHSRTETPSALETTQLCQCRAPQSREGLSTSGRAQVPPGAAALASLGRAVPHLWSSSAPGRALLNCTFAVYAQVLYFPLWAVGFLCWLCF